MIAGEASGDLYGARLTKSLTMRIPGLKIAGMGGDQMASSGVHLLYHHRDISVVGVFEVASKLSRLKDAFGVLKSWIDPVYILKWKEIYDSTEMAIDKCEDIANTIEGIVVKNG